ncbi:hypothetical protein ACJ41O_014615 [Fusarium nematophilum]
MSQRSVYLAKYRGDSRTRTHFAIFIPNIDLQSRDVSVDFKDSTCKGTIIQVVGEPLMAGYGLEIKRNYDCTADRDLGQLIPLGHAAAADIYEPTSPEPLNGDAPRARLEREAAQVAPPPKGQDVRAPIDGVDLIDQEAVEIVQSHRDAPTHGIFGYKG